MLKKIVKKIKEFVLSLLWLPVAVFITLSSIKKDKEFANSFVDETEFSLREMYMLNMRAAIRHPFVTGQCSFDFKIKRAHHPLKLVFPETYRCMVANDKAHNCTWLWVKYEGKFPIRLDDILGTNYVRGYLYKLPYIGKDNLQENQIIDDKLNEIDNDGKGRLIKEFNQRMEDAKDIA